jgi:hypothetical protein
MIYASGQSPEPAISNVSQRIQVADELDLVRDEADRARNVGWEPKLPGDDTNVSHSSR